MDYKSAVMAQAETKVTTLDNGLRVATEYVRTRRTPVHVCLTRLRLAPSPLPRPPPPPSPRNGPVDVAAA